MTIGIICLIIGIDLIWWSNGNLWLLIPGILFTAVGAILIVTFMKLDKEVRKSQKNS
ncbi:hypothetical protein [Bacillus sp. BP-3]|uniref:hypothetical protein n=1 Tax=Bacillus sp. BP-3 TaxID=3022773 RepID=UPI00232D6E95|nr:hypothetical protein [Bacillus sp. BP-3]MDC2863639.1 hypothetical protein [Bacillus sp. BP-3]